MEENKEILTRLSGLENDIKEMKSMIKDLKESVDFVKMIYTHRPEKKDTAKRKPSKEEEIQRLKAILLRPKRKA